MNGGKEENKKALAKYKVGGNMKKGGGERNKKSERGGKRK